MSPSYLTTDLNIATGATPSAAAIMRAQDNLAELPIRPMPKDPEGSSFISFSKKDIISFNTALDDLKTIRVKNYEILNSSPRIENIIIAVDGEDNIRLKNAISVSQQRTLAANTINPVHFDR